MMIKDILVHLDGGLGDEGRLAYAEMMASPTQAHLVGLFTNPLPDYASLVPIDGGVAAAGVLGALEDEARRQGDLIMQRLAERFSRLGVPNKIRRVDDTRAMLADCIAKEARWADLFIMTRPYRDGGKMEWDDLFEAVLFDSGRAIVSIPPGWRRNEAIRRILLCWRDTREASRAVAEAIPLIEASTQVMILAIDPEHETDDRSDDPTAEVARHLARHGARIDVKLLQSNGAGFSDLVMDQARRLSADLVVMGGYGHSRAREWMLGGATREMLEASEVPVLMAH
ncbi:universal stress protein [Microvirga terricola]|uniref:Universal stress protein n=1 Tax=Microvirga terricola TaxID=2719797 RepID=A0ABX0V9G3_9HYPH|nr:universal stress protein [Microvirga terricola]NIX75046.1 universal stress protein [Microvirga terricola]